MKIDDIETARKLFVQRDSLRNTIANLENSKVLLCNEDGYAFDEPDDYIVDGLIKLYGQSLALIEKEIREL